MLNAIVMSAAATVLAHATQTCFVYVDPVAFERRKIMDMCDEHGIECIQLWSLPYAANLVEQGLLDAESSAIAPPIGDELRWRERVLGDEADDYDVLGVLCGSDAGLACAERLQHALCPDRSNGINLARRDKFLQNEALRAAGLDAAKQCAPGEDWSVALAFLNSLPQPLQAVLKPRRGQDSLRVGLATSLAQARGMFKALCDAPVSLDSEVAPAPLLQEYLEGDEWVVDTVSRDGTHAVVALWRYEKEAANGAPFVYTQMALQPVQTSTQRALCDYACAALDALAWQWGPCHIEIKNTPRGPVLVEVNAGRFSGGDFQGLCDRCVGLNAYEATIAAYRRDDGMEWDSSVPARPPTALLAHGTMVCLISSVEGTLKGIDHMEQIDAMPSLMAFKPTYTEPGEKVVRTYDLATVAGHVMLAHANRAVLDADYHKLRELQPTLFVVERTRAAGVCGEPSEGRGAEVTTGE